MSLPNENGGGGFGFDNTFNGSPPPAPVSSSGGGSSGSEVARTVVFFVLAGVGMVVGLVLLVYLISVILDKWLCCCPGFQRIRTDSASLQLDTGAVAHKAGLIGLNLGERRQILNKAFVGVRYDKEMANHARKKKETENEGLSIPSGGDATKQEKLGDPLAEPDVEEGRTETDIAENESGEGKNDTKTEAKEDNGDTSDRVVAISPSGDALDDAEHYKTCAICLGDYGKKELVLHGKKCNHMFHYKCAMEWLEKHDHCPFCRKEMIKAKEFRAVAIEVLGESRVNALTVAAARAASRARDESGEDNNNSGNSSNNSETNGAAPNQLENAESGETTTTADATR